MTYPIRATVLASALVLLLGACGGEEDASGTDQVASLSQSADADSEESESASEETTSPDDAALSFSVCMRDEGIDFPDLSLDAEGNIALRGNLQDVNPGPGTEEFRTAMDACRSHLEQAGFGGDRAAIADNVEIQDAMVEFSDCVRDQGFDVGDLSFGAPGGNGGAGGGNQAGGDREGGFGSVNDRLAQGLGLDPEDPEVAAAMEVCAPIITQAFSNAGIGQGRG